MIDHTQLNRNKSKEAAVTATMTTTTSYVQQTAEMLDRQLTQTRSPYARFLNHLSTPPDSVQVPGTAQLDQEHLGRKERKHQKEKFDALGKKHTLLNEADMRELSHNKMFTNAEMRKSWEESKYRQSEVTNSETMRQLANKDYSNFENVQATLKNVVASKELLEFRQKYPELATMENYDVNRLVQRLKREGGVQALMNPALRLGLSLARNTKDLPDVEKENYRRLDEAMSTELMVETLIHKADVNDYKQRLTTNCGVPEAKAAGVAEAEIRAANAQQIEIAKRLLLMQLSNFKVYDKQGNSSDWNAPVAVALSHCRRVVLTMPVEQNSQAEKGMWDSIFHSENNAAAMDVRRAASTHSLKRRKIGSTGPTKEKKIRTGNFIGQRGMNVAIGGIGNSGISGKMIRNNGSCGHFYSMYKESSKDSYGAILFGLESDANGVVNQMGHRHNMKATAEAASSLGGQRVDELGADYGGRQCDLTHMTPGQIQTWMNALDRKMKEWDSADGGRAGGEGVEVMRILAGQKLSAEGLEQLKNRLGIS